MLTMATDEVDTRAAQSVWESLSDIAKDKGTSRQNIAKKVSRLEKAGLVETKRKGRLKLVNRVQYDKVIGEVEDPAKHLGGETARVNKESAVDDTYRDAKSKREGYQAELTRLDLEERLGRLRPVDEIADALTAMGREVLQSLDTMATSSSEELFSAAKKGDLAAFRKKYQKIVRLWAEQTAARLADAAVDQDNSL